MKQAIIFDLDGVIIDTERSVWLTSSQRLLAMYGKKHEEEKVGHLLYGSKFEDATQILYEFYAIEDSFENFLERRRQLVKQGFLEDVMFMEGFEEFFGKIAEHKKAIATSMDEAFLALTLRHLPLRALFNEHIYTISQSGGRGKPHPDIFLYAASKLDKQPRDCIVIEDAPKGVAAAKNAGMKVIGLATSTSAENLSQADYIATSFSAITSEILHTI